MPDLVGCYVALTPTWNETSYFADYVLPMGVGSERHDLHSYETHDSQWLGFRQPVMKAVRQREGKRRHRYARGKSRRSLGRERILDGTNLANRSRRSLGIRQFVESKKNPGTRLGVDEYYEWIFDNSVPGLARKGGCGRSDAAGIHATLRRV